MTPSCNRRFATYLSLSRKSAGFYYSVRVRQQPQLLPGELDRLLGIGSPTYFGAKGLRGYGILAGRVPVSSKSPEFSFTPRPPPPQDRKCRRGSGFPPGLRVLCPGTGITFMRQRNVQNSSPGSIDKTCRFLIAFRRRTPPLGSDGAVANYPRKEGPEFAGLLFDSGSNVLAKGIKFRHHGRTDGENDRIGSKKNSVTPLRKARVSCRCI